jgi:hypothetical protein
VKGGVRLAGGGEVEREELEDFRERDHVKMRLRAVNWSYFQRFGVKTRCEDYTSHAHRLASAPLPNIGVGSITARSTYSVGCIFSFTTIADVVTVEWR